MGVPRQQRELTDRRDVPLVDVFAIDPADPLQPVDVGARTGEVLDQARQLGDVVAVGVGEVDRVDDQLVLLDEADHRCRIGAGVEDRRLAAGRTGPR